jgi:2-keto-4-pentenoate hydratase
VGYYAWAVALEMPSSAIANLPDAGVAALVADRCAAGALLLGPVREGPLPDLSAARFTLSRDDEQLGEAGYEALVADPVEILREFMTVSRRYGFAPTPGQWVSTGGITPCYGFAPGERAVVRLDGAVEIDCRMDSSDRA